RNDSRPFLIGERSNHRSLSPAVYSVGREIRTMRNGALAAKLLLYSSGQFVVLTFAAMKVFPGGAIYEPGAKQYLFLQNFFSDLGGTLNPRGQSNLFSMVLFMVGLLSIGISLVASSPTWRRAIVRQRRSTLLGNAAQFFAALSGVCYAG